MRNHTVKFAYLSCLTPGRASSGGFIYASSEMRYSFAPLPLLAVQIVILLLAPRLLNIVLSRFNQPLFVSQVLGGMLFTEWGGFGYPFIPSGGVGGKPKGIQYYLFPEGGGRPLETLAHFSSAFFLFKLGVQMDLKMLKTSRIRTYILGLGCYICSLMFGVVLSQKLKSNIQTLEPVNPKAGFRGSDRIIDLFSLVSFPVIAYVLTDLNILNSDLGRLALQVAMVANCLQLVGQIWKSLGGLYHRGNHEQQLSVLLVYMGLFIFICFIVRPASLWIVKNTPEGKAVKESYISMIMTSVLLCGLSTAYCGLHVIEGAFFLGLAIPDGPPLGTTIVDKLDYMITTVLMPLHMGIVGLKLKIDKIEIHLEFLWRAVFVIIGCSLGKIIGVFIPAFFLGVPIQDSFLLGLIMNIKGIVEVSILNSWMDAKTANEIYDKNGISYAENSVMLLAVVLIAAVIIPLVKYLYDASMKSLTYQRRSILQWKENKTEFRVLACVHTQDDVPNIVRVLEACNPTKYTPVTVYTLHLVELVGRASPLFIAHPRHRRSNSSSNTSASERIVNAFQQFEDRFHNFVTVQSFTTISPYASMHNDICTMSVDKRTALIIFPFCRKEAISLRDDPARANISNRAIRSLLQNLLRNSPCSVGILIDRNTYPAQSTGFLQHMPYRVIIFFFGGPDDREALAFVMNMIHLPSVIVTLVRFRGHESLTPNEVINYDSKSTSVERHKFLDDELVDQYRINTVHDDTLMYEEVEVNDGSETIWAVQSHHKDFDLMVVGREQIADRQIFSGLNTDLSDERQELGDIGDAVTSPEYDAKGSILIIHQRLDIS